MTRLTKPLSTLFLFSMFLIPGMRAAEIQLTFSSPTSAEFYYPVTVTETVKATLNNGSQSTLTPSSGRLWISKGLQTASVTFDKPQAVTAVDFSSGFERTKITDIEINDIPNLEKIMIPDNALTWHVRGELPGDCAIEYGQQEPIEIAALRENTFNIGKYNSPGWESRLLYAADNSPVGSDYYSIDSYGNGRVLQNMAAPLRLQVMYADGLVLESQVLVFNKITSPFLDITTDGRGGSTTISFQSNQLVTQTMIAECEESYVESEIWRIDLNIPSIQNHAVSFTVACNLPQVITGLYLDNLGICELSLPLELPILKDVDLTGNSLLPSKIPADFRNCSVKLGEQKPFTLKTTGNAHSFDLSEEIAAGAVVEWVNSNGDIIDAGSYIESNCVYMFLADVGNVRAKITSRYYDDYLIYSQPVDIRAGMYPYMEFSWATAGGNPAIMDITASTDLVLTLGETSYSLNRGETRSIRLGEATGNTMLQCSDLSGISAIGLAGIGVINLNIGASVAGLERLDLTGNLFTPFNVPPVIPEGCKVEWGNPPVIDISGLTTAQNGIDMYIYSGFGIKWHSADDGAEIPTDRYTERAGFYTFENVGEIYASITLDGYDGLVFTTTEVDMSALYYSVMEFEASGHPVALIGFNRPTRIDINGYSSSDYFNGDATIDFGNLISTNSGNSAGRYILSVNYPEAITSIEITGCGIKSIVIADELVNLEYLDLSGNSLHFGTFPAVENCLTKFDNQDPVELEVDYDNSTVWFPLFADCADISVVNGGSSAVEPQSYEISSTNDYMVFKNDVSDVAVKFSGHPDFPGVDIYSAPITLSPMSGIDYLKEDAPFTVQGKTVKLSPDTSGTLYSPDGRLLRRLTRGATVQLEKGFYILLPDKGSGYKFAL